MPPFVKAPYAGSPAIHKPVLSQPVSFKVRRSAVEVFFFPLFPHANKIIFRYQAGKRLDAFSFCQLIKIIAWWFFVWTPHGKRILLPFPLLPALAIQKTEETIHGFPSLRLTSSSPLRIQWLGRWRSKWSISFWGRLFTEGLYPDN